MLTEQQLLQQFKALPPAKQLEVINFIHALTQTTSSEPAPIPKRLGLLRGKLTVAEDFDAPLPDDIINAFYNDRS
jgi:Protein of unknown function (DUF2281)